MSEEMPPDRSGGGLKPPQDLAAEAAVLGSMMLSKDAIADVVEILQSDFFYRPAHQEIYLAVLELFGRGEPADIITVADQLSKSALLTKVGGAAYLTELTAGLPTAANASYHAAIVRERALLRRLVEAATRIQQWGYAGEGDVDDVVNRAQAEIYEVTQARSSEDYQPIGDLMDEALSEIEAIGNRSGEMVGVPTGLRDLDRLTQGLHPGQLVILAARPAIGKALALDTLVATPEGGAPIGDLVPGDKVLGWLGDPVEVLAVSEVLIDRPCYEISFVDGSSFVADAAHLWLTCADGGVEAGIRTTQELSDSLDCGRAHYVPCPDGDRFDIAAVVPTDSVPVRCIQVDSADGMFRIGRNHVPTHNSTLGLDIARSASVGHGLASVIFSLEMSRTEIIMRLLSADAAIQLGTIRAGRMGDAEWQKISKRQGPLAKAPLFIDDSPNMTMTEIRAKCRRLKQNHDLRLVIVDYMQLMTSGKKVESRQQEVSEFSRSLKLLAKEIQVPVIAISQLNRGPEQRTDKKPMLSDLRESGSLEQDADVVVLIHREDFYDKENRPGEADLIVAKHRNGPTDTIPVSFQGHYSRFVDLAG